MKRLKTHHWAVHLIVTIVAMGMLFLPGLALAQEAPAEPVTTTTELPLLGSNIIIELTTTDDGTVAAVTVDGELVDSELEEEDGEIKIEFLLTTEDGVFEVKVKFENDDVVEIELEREDDDEALQVEPGPYAWDGTACDGSAIGFTYEVTADGELVFGAVTGDTKEIEAEDDKIKVKFLGEIEVEIELDDGQLDTKVEVDCDDDDFDDDEEDEDEDEDE